MSPKSFDVECCFARSWNRSLRPTSPLCQIFHSHPETSLIRGSSDSDFRIETSSKRCSLSQRCNFGSRAKFPRQKCPHVSSLGELISWWFPGASSLFRPHKGVTLGGLSSTESVYPRRSLRAWLNFSGLFQRGNHSGLRREEPDRAVEFPRHVID